MYGGGSGGAANANSLFGGGGFMPSQSNTIPESSGGSLSNSKGNESAPSSRAGGDDAGRRHRAEPPDARPRSLRMDWAACDLPLHGEDARFGHAEAGFVGVADGVGGCRDDAVDANAFSRELMASALAYVEQAAKSSKLRRRLRPEDVLERAYEKAFINGTPGASTAVIMSLDGATLRWAYIGDSGFAVLRDGKIVHRSMQQQHYFTCPYQLSSDGDGDSLSKAKVGDMPVEDGDVVVLGTDGLFDNMGDEKLEHAVSMGTELGLSPKNMADTAARIAYNVSMDEWADSPFSRECSKEHGELVCGGKKDDMTVIVACIVSKDS
ncbi:unnamed protein product [Urochloa decumbens]|uniref:Protein phosphatase n=1 Tax=Urochloa decumbens TaxID=240449 RepID=A0ABC9EF18_9POAL